MRLSVVPRVVFANDVQRFTPHAGSFFGNRIEQLHFLFLELQIDDLNDILAIYEVCTRRPVWAAVNVQLVAG